jgi:hypothetical protein
MKRYHGPARSRRPSAWTRQAEMQQRRSKASRAFSMSFSPPVLQSFASSLHTRSQSAMPSTNTPGRRRCSWTSRRARKTTERRRNQLTPSEDALPCPLRLIEPSFTCARSAGDTTIPDKNTGNGRRTFLRLDPDESLQWFYARLHAPEAWGGFSQPARDLICRVLGHRDICGPDPGGRTVCAFCRTVLSRGTTTRSSS